jgi:hypothetical protein
VVRRRRSERTSVPAGGRRHRFVPRLPPDLRSRQAAIGRPGTIGIALSGGGIRSASYNLGVLQALSEHGVLERADYLAAVSGGAYIASAYAIAETERAKSGSVAGIPVFARGSPEERYLRDHSSYIAPTPSGKVRALLVWFGGFLANLVILGVALFVAGTLLGWLYWKLYPCLRFVGPAGSGECTLRPLPPSGHAGQYAYLWVPGGILLGGFAIYLLSTFGDWASSRTRRIRTWESRFVIFGLIALAVLGLPYLIPPFRDVFGHPGAALSTIKNATHGSGGGTPASPAATSSAGAAGVPSFVWLTQLVVGLNVLIAGVRLFLAKRRSIYASIVGVAAGPVLLLIPFLWIVSRAASRGATIHYVLGSFQVASWAAVLVLCVVITASEFLFNCNRTSLHAFYAWRLSTAFALRRATDPNFAEPIPQDNPLLLSGYQPLRQAPGAKGERAGPQFIYCAAANSLTEGSVPPGRNAVPFTFSSDTCGGRLIGRVSTQALEHRTGGLSLSDAVAISGAAFSPVMGKLTHRAYILILTLLNARLGQWVLNPAYLPVGEQGQAPGGALHDARSLRARAIASVNRAAERIHFSPRPGLRYLLYEFFGSHRLDRRYVYVTDGGHYDNLGLLELLEQGCTTVYVFDASGDKVDTFFTLGEAVGLARSDQLVDISIEPEGLKPDSATDLSRTDVVVGSISYFADAGASPVLGKLVFAKAAITSDLPWDVRAFRAKDKSFPNNSTVDQLFTDQKFESYRELGYEAATHALKVFRAHCLQHAFDGPDQACDEAAIPDG